MITLKRFRRLEQAVIDAGYCDSIAWSEGISRPRDPDDFAGRAVYVICNSGLRTAVAVVVHERCMEALHRAGSVKRAFGHPGKAAAIDLIWATRSRLFDELVLSEDVVAFCRSLPWIGPITSYHLAKNLGADVAKSDVHLRRLADYEEITAQQLCARLAAASGYRIATVDTILWRACESGIVNSKSYAESGWRHAVDGRC